MPSALDSTCASAARTVAAAYQNYPCTLDTTGFSSATTCADLGTAYGNLCSSLGSCRRRHLQSSGTINVESTISTGSSLSSNIMSDTLANTTATSLNAYLGSDFAVVALEPATTAQVSGVTGSINSPEDGGAQGMSSPSSSSSNAGAIVGIIFTIFAVAGIAFCAFKYMGTSATPIKTVHAGPTVPTTVHPKHEKPTTELVSKEKVENFAQI